MSLTTPAARAGTLRIHIPSAGDRARAIATEQKTGLDWRASACQRDALQAGSHAHR